MSEKLLTISLIPSYATTAYKLGFNPNEYSINDDEIMYRQGYDTLLREIKPGSKFKIPEGYDDVSISCEETQFKLILTSDDGEQLVSLHEEEYIILSSGNYYFHSDGVTIEEIVGLDIDEGNISDANEELIWTEITDSGKTRFDFDTFKEVFDQIDDNLADSIVFQTIVGLAFEESKQLVAAKLFNSILMTGYMIKKEELDEFLSDKEDLFSIEIEISRLAGAMLNDNTNPIAVLQFVKNMLNP